MFNWFNSCQKYKSILCRIEYNDVKQEVILPKPCLPEASLSYALENRRSIRQFSPVRISQQELSNILWSAAGVNLKVDETHRLLTTPTASNHQEIKIYGINKTGGFVYMPETHSIVQIYKGDIRSFIGEQDFVGTAPLIICIAVDYSRMVKHNIIKKIRYSRIDAGYVSQNIYLYCAAAGLGTVACGKINRSIIKRIFKISDGGVLLCHPIGERL